MMKRVISCLLLIVTLAAVALLLSACGSNEVETSSHRVAIEVENYGTIELELYPNKAPITVANFEKLVKEGFYDGLTFHRVISSFMIQGGDPLGNGMGGSGLPIKGEFSANGYEGNDIKHVRGVISMARSNSYDSASSQFFIMHGDAPNLDGNYAAFGRVTSGMDVVDAIAAAPVESNLLGEKSVPETAIIITRVYMIEN